MLGSPRVVIDLPRLKWLGTWLQTETLSSQHNSHLQKEEIAVFCVPHISHVGKGNLGVRRVIANVHRFYDPTLLVTSKRVILLDSGLVVDSVPYSEGYVEGTEWWLKIVGPPDIGGETPNIYYLELGHRNGWWLRLLRYLLVGPSDIHYCVRDYIQLAAAVTYE